MHEPVISEEVGQALRLGLAVVALESTIFSELGLPSPHNREAIDRVTRAVRGGRAVPALTAVLDGMWRVGLDPVEHDRICGPTRKAARRDLGVAVAQGWPYGATTVSASVTLAAAAGIAVFATGGIGGVHRGAEITGDISADLDALATNRVLAVTAGAKVFLDLPRTIEYLETASVPVIGWRCDEFPAFHAPTSGIPLTVRADSAAEVADMVRAHWAVGGHGVVLACPVPEADGVPLAELSAMVDDALASTDASSATGAAVTPAVLNRLADISGGRTIRANLALAEHNAAVAAQVATALGDTAR